MPPLNPASARYFRDEFRAARTRALRDAEDFGAVVVVLERLAHYLSPKVASLGAAAGPLATVAKASCLSLGSSDGEYGLTFKAHLDTLRRGRNMAVHEGALARHLTQHAVSVALILEHALMANDSTAAHVMVRNPIVAHPWQPLSFLRQSFLVNSFSYMPVAVSTPDGPKWRLVSDLAVARYLRCESFKVAAQRLLHSLEEATVNGLVLLDASTCVPDTPIASLLTHDTPTLVLAPQTGDLLGILTPFDLL